MSHANYYKNTKYNVGNLVYTTVDPRHAEAYYPYSRGMGIVLEIKQPKFTVPRNHFHSASDTIYVYYFSEKSILCFLVSSWRDRETTVISR